MCNFTYIGAMLDLLAEGFVALREIVRVCAALKILNQGFY